MTSEWRAAKVLARLRRPITAATYLALIAGCSAPKSEVAQQSTSDDLFQLRSQAGLEIRTRLRRDTVSAGDPIELIYFIVNGPLPTPFLNDPDLFGPVVETTDGDPAPVKSAYAVTRSLGDRVKMLMPAHGMLGQVANLRCLGNAYAVRTTSSACEIAYDLDRPGTYRVITQYRPPKQGAYAHPDIADTLRLVVR
jgi:hypothetical protein